MGGNRDPTLASSTAETDGRRSKRAVSPVDHVRDEPEHRHQKDEGEPEDTIHPTDPGVLVHPQRDEEECDVEREEEQPERDRRARRGRLKRDRDVCQDDGHLDHSTARSRSRGIPSSNIYIIMHEFAKPTGGEAAGRADHGRIAARPAAPASPPDSSRDAFMAGQSSPTLGADVKSSEVSGFYKKSPQDRWQVIRSFGELSDAEVETIQNTGALKFDQVDRMIENVVGAMPVPLGIAVNFQVNGRDYLVPMAIEEPSVVAAASNAARMARERGGFSASTSGPIMIGQIQLVGVSDPHGARMTILHHKDEILSIANEKDPMLVKVGGGAKDVEVRVVDTKRGHMVVTHLVVDCRDAMGANAVNTMAEAIAPHIEKWTGGRVYLRIILNLAGRRLARARAVFAKDAIRTEDIPGEDVVEGVLEAYAFADAGPFRFATHNKGIMNGLDAVVVATGHDWRAIEAGAHAYAAWKSGGYRSLTAWEKDANGDLVGTIELPMAVGLVGGATAVHPTAKANVHLLGVKTAQELAEVIAAVGLAQNFAALRALATEGIQRGHMSLHARNVAATVGAVGEEVDRVAEILVKEREVRMDRAKEVLSDLRSRKS